MFQRLSSLFFGEVEEVAAEIKGENPCVTEADEEGWMLVNLPARPLEGETEAPSRPDHTHARPSPRDSMQTTPLAKPCPPLKRRRTHPKSSTAGSTLSRRGAKVSPLSASSSPGSGRECRGSSSSSRAGSERGCMDESWFVTPPPCFTAEGATAEASPMEDLLIEHPSMSVYVSPGSLSMVSNVSLSVVGEESVTASLAGSVRVVEQPAAPAMPTRASRGAAAQAGALAKVTQVARVQRGKARIERRHLSRNRIQRQNRVREQVPRHAAHARNTFLHQPGNRSVCH
ncbi:hypothetical protein CRUP_020179 [Coryphaenoides rupestris]|nr:hypothetical protein CRUP_020179 [Coryphaenoides rupestris]